MAEPYYDFGTWIRSRFPFRVQKLSVDAGFSCPNRDGRISTGGCTFCDNRTFNPAYCNRSKSVTEQLEDGKAFFARKYPDMKYLAYFQAYTNTYAPAAYLEQIFTEALSCEKVCGISIATRPDCLPPDVLALLARCRDAFPDKFLWVELGLQTIHPATADYIRRGFDLACFETAVRNLKALSIPVIVHTILGLPGESADAMYETISYVNELSPFGIKLQLLHVLEGTDLARDYRAGKVPVLSLEEYISILEDCLAVLPPDMVIHRLTGDGAKRDLLAPLWSGDKKRVLNAIRTAFQRDNVRQGSRYLPQEKLDTGSIPVNKTGGNNHDQN